MSDRPPENYFIDGDVAARYARDRPRFHSLVIERIQRFTGCARVRDALDAACGTGHSTIALAEMADHVIGIDRSPEMLRQAPSLPGVEFLEGSAEALPVEDRSFDLVTVGLAFHWLQQDRFLSEADRVLRHGGWLVVYNNGFTGRMRESCEFADWWRGNYLVRYPSPPRCREPLDEKRAAGSGFRLALTESYTNEVLFTARQMVRYLLTQSNIISAVEHGRAGYDEAARELAEALRPHFGEATRTMEFAGEISYLQRES